MKNFKLTARDKLIIVLINILIVVSVEKGRYLVLSLFFIIALLIMFLFKPDYRKLPVRVFSVFLYPLFVSIFIPFTNSGNILKTIDLKLLTLSITDNGLMIFFSVLFKSFISIFIISSFILSVGEIEILHGLKKIKMPGTIVSIIFLMYRYLFLIKEESKVGQMAINSRVFKKSYFSANRKLIYLMGTMFMKSLDRVENIYRSMESRGFTGDFHISENDAEFKGLSFAFLTIFIIIPLTVKVVEFCNLP